MNVYNTINFIMLCFFISGAIDLTFDNRFGLGDEFQKGFMTSGKLLLLMSGYICLAPVMADILRPVLAPLFQAIGADPSLFAGVIFSCDAGGAPLALELANTREAGYFSGYIIGAIMGPTITFTIPVSIASVSTPRDRICVIYGLLAGISTAPIGMFFGGLVAGFPLSMLMRSLWPIVLFAALLFVMLLLFTDHVLKLFIFIGKVALGIAYLGLTAATIEKMTGFQVIKGMAPIDDVFSIVGGIALILAGAFPMLAVVTRCFPQIIELVSRLLGVSTASVGGLLATTANSIVTFGMLSDMDEKGKMLNVAFAVAAAWALGDHLGFTAQTAPCMLVPMVAAKLLSGAAAVVLASLLYRRKFCRKV